MSVVTSSTFLCSSSILSSSSESNRRPPSNRYSSAAKSHERQSLIKNPIYGDSVVDSFLISSSNNLNSQPTSTPPQDVPKSPPSNKRYVSSFKTLVNSTSGKNSQRLTYVNDSVIIVKLSKDGDAPENSTAMSPVTNKSTMTMATPLTYTTPIRKQPYLSPSRLSPVLKLETQKRRTVAHHDSSSTASASNNQLTISSYSVTNMATTTTSHSPTNPSLFHYRNVVTGSNTARARTFNEASPNNLLITTERIKTNISPSMRPTRQPLPTPTATVSSTYVSTQQMQRNSSQNGRSRLQQEKLTNPKDVFEYPDPFANCPQEFLNKLAQLTKLQLDTIEWEKKRRFTKKKVVTNGIVQGKDSP